MKQKKYLHLVTSILTHFALLHFFKSADDKLQLLSPHEQTIATAKLRPERAVFKMDVCESMKVLLRFFPEKAVTLPVLVALAIDEAAVLVIEPPPPPPSP